MCIESETKDRCATVALKLWNLVVFQLLRLQTASQANRDVSAALASAVPASLKLAASHPEAAKTLFSMAAPAGSLLLPDMWISYIQQQCSQPAGSAAPLGQLISLCGVMAEGPAIRSRISWLTSEPRATFVQSVLGSAAEWLNLDYAAANTDAVPRALNIVTGKTGLITLLDSPMWFIMLRILDLTNRVDLKPEHELLVCLQAVTAQWGETVQRADGAHLTQMLNVCDFTNWFANLYFTLLQVCALFDWLGRWQGHVTHLRKRMQLTNEFAARDVTPVQLHGCTSAQTLVNFANLDKREAAELVRSASTTYVSCLCIRSWTTKCA